MTDLIYYLNEAHACDEANEFYREKNMAKKKMQKQKCCPDKCPAVGDVYTCAECGFAVEVTVACACEDAECVALACCGKPMTKK
jgi:hypothetical protein